MQNTRNFGKSKRPLFGTQHPRFGTQQPLFGTQRLFRILASFCAKFVVLNTLRRAGFTLVAMALRRDVHSAESLRSGLSFLLRAASSGNVDDLRGVAEETRTLIGPSGCWTQYPI